MSTEMTKYEAKDAADRIHNLNLRAAEVAAEVTPDLVLRLAEDAVLTEDPELRRKLTDTIHKIAGSTAPKQALPTSNLPPLNFQIVLDSTPQVPPPNKRPRALEMVEEVPLVTVKAVEDDGPSLSDYLD